MGLSREIKSEPSSLWLAQWPHCRASANPANIQVSVRGSEQAGSPKKTSAFYLRSVHENRGSPRAHLLGIFQQAAEKANSST